MGEFEISAKNVIIESKNLLIREQTRVDDTV